MSSWNGLCALVIASPQEIPERDRVWGTGGWVPADSREALDWVVLLRCLGWEVDIAMPSSVVASLRPWTRWVIVACDTELLSVHDVAALEAHMFANPSLVILRPGNARSGASDSIFSHQWGMVQREDGKLIWTGPGATLAQELRTPLSIASLEPSSDDEVWAVLGRTPIVVARWWDKSTICTLAFHPSAARDNHGAFTRVLIELLTFGVPPPVAWLDLSHTLVLRMDDPGSAQNLYLKSWSYQELGPQAWSEIAEELATRRARLSVCYCPGWVDDGDPDRGYLEVQGTPVKRYPGRVHPSPQVRYLESAGGPPGLEQDYAGEYEAIRAIRASGLGDIELHGFTHMHPNSSEWASAPDRYTKVDWFRELGPDSTQTLQYRNENEHPLRLGLEAMWDHFGTRPTTLVFPGDSWTQAAIDLAADLQFDFVSSYYLAVRHFNRLLWSTHICAPYLDEPSSAWFDSGLPVIGYFHDKEPSESGVEWLSRWLDNWEHAGAKRFIDFRELASAIHRRLTVRTTSSGTVVDVNSEQAPAAVRPIPIKLRLDLHHLERIFVRDGSTTSVVRCTSETPGVFRCELPVLT